MAALGSKLTIQDIAHLAGVSKTTVSRYLNGQYHLLKEETRQIVEKTVRESGYYPSRSARSLKSQRSGLIGVIIADIATPFSSAILQGIGNVLEPQGYVPIFVNCNSDPVKEQQCVADLMAHDVEGLIVNSSCLQSQALTDVVRSGFPLVLCDRPVEGVSAPLVTSDISQALGQMLACLKEQGYSLPYLLAETPEKSMVRQLRIAQYLRLAADIYPEADTNGHVFPVDTANALATRRLLKTILQKAEGKPAVVGVNTMTTIHLLGVMNSMGIRIPQEMGICGPDDWSWGQQLDWTGLMAPGISTIAVPSRQIGEQTAQVLIQLLEGQTPPDAPVLLPGQWVRRASTG